MQKIEPKKIKELRTNQGLSQQKLAQLLGISDRAIFKWELGYSQPSANHLITMAQILGVSIDNFLSTNKASPQEEIQGMN